jgi:hypothetical protein
MVFFEAQPFGLQKHPDCPPIGFDAARGELGPHFMRWRSQPAFSPSKTRFL